MPGIQLVDLVKQYGSVTACSGLNLDIRDGEFLTLLGPSGCGKSTLLNMIAGLEDITSGQILMDGRLVNEMTPSERDVAMVFQSYGLYPHMTVAQNIGFSLRMRKRPKKEIAQRVKEVAESLELTKLLDRLPRELSGGQQQRVALGRAVVREPQVFLFDEPFSNLDAALRVRMRGEVKILHERIGVTSIFVTHDQEEALSMSDRIVVLSNGHIEQVGTPLEVYSRPVSKYVASFVGSPQMSFLTGTVEASGEDAGFRCGTALFDIDQAEAATLTEHSVDLGVRAEHVLLNRGGGVAATVSVCQPQGPATDVTVAWDGGTLVARVPGFAAYDTGAQVTVSIDPNGRHWFDRETGKRIEAVQACRVGR
ncbi:sn-glycerol-3-phosphate ABC transporter ATP-binding protein UgpC [Mycobacterium sp. 21AC1]|uniref:ABC transporter ATP-binding protein n=1 Tax=[Mycobacterium] appelbergii TaxID=2939269 RepID=UPI0029394670|nr:sn-glycerol-3-phosphate ABC transporter ATP-binding protein UgpC [Mycobacterium sp. 21AC1]MDV3126000.1 sn-glycerol-3-phosphate ABC transporter ATP-binding protein UgpC [Mycobacterium sp. 21AC1]